MDFFTKFLKDPELTRYLPLKRPYTRSEISQHLAARINHWKVHQFGIFILVLKSNFQKVAYCGLEHVGETEYIDIRYGILSYYSGKGLIQEAAGKTIEFGFNSLELPVIYGAAMPENKASVTILEKLGMTRNSHVDFYGHVVDYYSISRKENR